MSLIKDARKEGDRASNLPGQVASLKKKLGGAQQEIVNLKKRVPPRTDIRLQDDTMVLTETITHDGKAYQNAKTVAFGEAYKSIRPMIEPLVQIARAAALGNDVVSRRQKAHEIGPDGKPTKDLLKDEEGKQVYLPNVRDKAQAISDLLMSDPDCIEALRKISERLQAMEEIKARAHKVANYANKLGPEFSDLSKKTEKEKENSPNFF